MNPELLLAFAAATALIIIIPGPVVTLVLANSIAYGTRPALLTVVGAGTAATLQLAVIGFGMASLIALLSEWFQWVRWAGVAYLIWLGIQAWRNGRADPSLPQAAASHSRLYLQGFIVAATNPKTLLFYAAFLPQFVDPTGAVGAQMAVLCAVFLCIALTFDSSYALLAGRLRPLMLTRRGARWRGRVTGMLLIGTGLWLAMTRKTS